MMLIARLCAAMFAFAIVSPPAQSATLAPKPIASLGVFFQNDNEGYQPTSAAERARMTAIERQLKTALEDTGTYKFVPMTAEVQADIAKGQQVSECGGCEIDYGKRLGAEAIAWVRVQKISNLIMNMNVYLADVATGKMIFQHSVDVRSNTDESWSRSMAYLLKNYLLPAIDKPARISPSG